MTRIKDFINNPDGKDIVEAESKLDTLKGIQIKLSDIRNEYYEIIEDETDLQLLEVEILDLEDECEDIQVRIKHIISNVFPKNNSVVPTEISHKNIKLPEFPLPEFYGTYEN